MFRNAKTTTSASDAAQLMRSRRRMHHKRIVSEHSVSSATASVMGSTLMRLPPLAASQEEPASASFQTRGFGGASRSMSLFGRKPRSEKAMTPPRGRDTPLVTPEVGVRKTISDRTASTTVWTPVCDALPVYAPSADAAGSPLASLLLEAVSVMDPQAASEVFSANDQLAQTLLQMWLNDDDISMSNCCSEAIVSFDYSSDDIAPRALVIDSWGSLCLSSSVEHPCGCSGGSLWRVRYGKQPKIVPSSSFVSKLLAWWNSPRLAPLLNDCDADPDVEVLRIQYLGERYLGASAATSVCYHTLFRGAYIGCARGGSELKLMKMTPTIVQEQIALMVYRKDRENGRCMLFNGRRSLSDCLSWSEDNALALNYRELLDTTRAARSIYSRHHWI